MKSLSPHRLLVLIPIAILALLSPAGAAAQGPALPSEALDPFGAGSASAQKAKADDAETGSSDTGNRAGAGMAEAKINVWFQGLRGGKLDAGEKIRVFGNISPFVGKQKIRIAFKRGKKVVETRNVRVTRKPGRNIGQFKATQRFVRPGAYRIFAAHRKTGKQDYARANTEAFKLRYPSLSPGQSNSKVRLLNNQLERYGYVPSKGDTFSDRTARAVLAFRKVNNLSRSSTSMSAKMFKKLAAGRGSYRVKRPDMGRHVEADLSRQVMVLIDDGKPVETYHVSTGAPSTPTHPGTWNFLRREPGYNNVEMYYSVYYNGGYAIHGYKSVPTYPASHGCLRNPIPDSKHIYDWVSVGMPIHITR